MRLPICVILCSAFALTFWSADSLAESFTFHIPSGECLLTSSIRAQPFVSEALLQLNSRFAGACAQLSAPMEDALSASSHGVWTKDNEFAKFGFWVDASANGSEMMIRGIDLVSYLVWGQAKASTVNLTEASRGEVIKVLMERVIDQYPFVGFIEGNEFFSWARPGAFKVAAVKRKVFNRHPFLPFLLQTEVESRSNKDGMLAKGDRWTLDFPDKLQAAERLWLKSSFGDLP